MNAVGDRLDRQTTPPKMSTMAPRLIRMGRFWPVASRWNRAMTAPSKSVPQPVWMVAGEKLLPMIVSQMWR